MKPKNNVQAGIGTRPRLRFVPFDLSGVFHAANESDVQRLAIRGAGATLLSSGASLGVQIFSTVILARLLMPSDFGLVAMVSTFSLLLSNFGLNGFTEALIQREKLDHRLASNIFWTSVGAGIVISIAFVASGALLVKFYHNPLVGPVVAVASSAILITSCSVVHLALLKRAMLFSRVAANDIVARAISILATIVLALEGWRYWALVAGMVLLALTQSVGACILCKWRPGAPRRAAGTISVVRFAANVYAHFAFNYFARNTDNLLVGWLFGAQSLGFYKKAYDLFALSVSQTTAPLTNVAVSALSRFDPNSHRYRQSLLNALAVTTFLGMGLGADLTLVGKDVIRVVLGPGWEPAGRLFRFFGPGVGVMLLYTTHNWIHLSIGKADRWFRWGLIEYGVTVLLLVVGLRWDTEGIALAWTVSFWLLTMPALWYALKPIQLGIGPVIGVVWRYPIASLGAGLAAATLMRNFPALGLTGGAAIMRIVVASLGFSILYVASVVLIHGGIAPLRLVGRLLRKMAEGGLPFRRATTTAVDGVLSQSDVAASVAD